MDPILRVIVLLILSVSKIHNSLFYILLFLIFGFSESTVCKLVDQKYPLCYKWGK